MVRTVLGKLAILLDNVRFEHTVFALPFAYLGMILAEQRLPGLWQVVWITVAMASARTLAMSANRLIDRHLDARNPRTMNELDVFRLTNAVELLGELFRLPADVLGGKN